jgi:hypothetical protein
MGIFNNSFYDVLFQWISIPHVWFWLSLYDFLLGISNLWDIFPRKTGMKPSKAQCSGNTQSKIRKRRNNS